MRRTGGWKVVETLQWEDSIHSSQGGWITGLWKTKYQTLFKHKRNKFDPTATATVANSVRSGLKDLYDYLDARTSKDRKGSCDHDIPDEESAAAGYIWRALKKQAYLLDKQDELNEGNMLPALAELIDELSSGVMPGTKARERAGKAPVVLEIPDSTNEESGSDRDTPPPKSDIASVISKVNASIPMRPGGLDPWMKDALRRLHTMTRKYVADRDSVFLDTGVFPNPSQPSAEGTAQATYKRQSIASLESEAVSFANSSRSQTNPFAKLRMINPGGASRGVDERKGKRKVARRSGASDPDKERLAKRMRSSEALKGATRGYSMQTDGEKTAASAERLELIAAQCTNAWDSCQALQGAVYLGMPTITALWVPVRDGMFHTIEMLDEISSSDNPVALSLAKRVKDLDSFAARI